MSYNPANVNGQAAMSDSTPVVIAFDQSTLSISGTVTSNITNTIGVSGSTAISNFPSNQTISGTVTSNIPNTIGISGSTSISNFPTLQNVNISDTIGISGSTSILNFPATQTIAGTVTANIPNTIGISGTTTVNGTVTANLGTIAGVSTAANQTTQINSLSSIDGKIPVKGSTVMTGATPVVIASDQVVPISGSISVSNFPATQNVNVPQTIGISGTTTVNGTITANLGTIAGVATASNQTTSNNSLSSIDGKIPSKGQAPMSGSTPIVIASDQTAVPVSGSISVSNFPATQNVNIPQVIGISGSTSILNFPATQTIAGTVTANITNTIGVSGTTTVNGTVSINALPAGSNTIGSVKITDGTNTAEILNLAPTGDTGQSAIAVRIISSLASSGSGGSGVQYVNGVANGSPTGTLALGYDGANLRALKTATDGTLKIDGSAVTQPVNIANTVGISGTTTVNGTITANLGTIAGVATSANQTTQINSLSSIDGKIPVKGQAPMSGSTPVVIASDQTAIPISGSISVSNFPATQNVNVPQTIGISGTTTVNGTVTANIGTGNLAGITNTVVIKADTAGNQTNALKVDGSAVTQPVSIAGTVATNIANTVGISGTTTVNGSVNLLDSAGTNKAKVFSSGAVSVQSPDTTSLSNSLTPTSGNATVLALNGHAGVGVQITGTWTGTVTFEGTLDGTNWFAIVGTNPVSGYVTVTTATANGQWRFSTPSYQSFRVRCSVTGTGTATVNIVATTQSALISTVEGIKIWDGLGSGNVLQITNTNAMSIVQSDKIQGANTIAMTATGNVVSLSLAGRATASFVVTGVWTGTIVFEATVDGVNFNTINYYDPVNNINGSTITANGTFRCGVAGYQTVRLKSSVSGTGTATVSAMGSGMPGPISIQDPLPSGINVIGALTANQSVNQTQMNGVALSSGSGASNTGTQRVILASDQTAVPIVGNQSALSTSSWTSATASNTAATVTTTNMNTVTVAVVATTTITGGVLTFEVSPDNTNWFPVTMCRIDSYTVENTYTLVASTSRAWSTSVDGFTNFRVRLSTVITGSATVTVLITAQVFAIEPIITVGQSVASNLNATVTQQTLTKGTQGATGVSTQDLKDAGRSQISINWEEMTGTAAAESTLTNFTSASKADAAVSAATNYTVTAGKTLRIQSVNIYVKATSTIINLARFRIRQAASSIANSSPIIWDAVLPGSTAATVAAGTGVPLNVAIPDGLEVAGGQQITFTWFTQAATCTVGMSIIGYEY